MGSERTIENNLTQGSVFTTLWKFTLPFIGARLLQTLYSMVDLYIVGRYATTADVSAVSVSGTITTSLLMVLIGISVGATVIVGQRFGAGDKKSLSSAASTFFSLAWIIGAVLSVIIFVIAVPALQWINTPEEAMKGAIAYTRICSVGFIFLAVYNMLSGFLRGMGDSRSPLLFVGISTVVNIFGDILLVGVFGLGAAGAAIATVFAQMICMVYGIFHVKKKGFPFDFRPKSYRIVKEDVQKLFQIGMPVAVQELLVMISFFVLEMVINEYGLDASAAAGILDKLFLVAMIPTTAFNNSISAMVAQNIGAQKPQRAIQCLMYGSLLSGLFAVAFFILAWVMPARLVGIFTTDTGVIQEGIQYIAGYKLDFLACSLFFCITGFLNGAGRTRFTLINNFVSTYLVRIPFCLVAAKVLNAGLYGIGFTLPAASLVSLIIAYVYFFQGKWK